jgi:DNA excision repair protein ERCC-4
MQTTNEISGDIQQSSIISKVTLLAMSFPNLRFLWSRSPAASAQIMRAISQGHDAPDVHKAMQAGAGSDGRTAAAIMGTTEEECGTDYTARSGDYATEAEARLSAQEMLLSLPGITVHNFRGVMDSIRDIAELSTMSEAKLAPLIGPGNGKKLRAFFKQSLLL